MEKKEKSGRSADAPEGKERGIDAKGKNNSEKVLKCLSCYLCAVKCVLSTSANHCFTFEIQMTKLSFFAFLL